MLYTFEIEFGYDGYTSFDLDLSEQEVAYIKNYLEENGDCDYGYLEHDKLCPSGLFDKINDAGNAAVLEAINARRRDEFEKGELLDEEDNLVTEYRIGEWRT